MKQPWHRLKRETDKAWHAFQCYLLMGRVRTHQTAWDQYAREQHLTGTLPSRSFRNWTFKNKWTDRCRAYDDHHAELRMERIEAQRAAAEDVLIKEAENIAKSMVVTARGKKTPGLEISPGIALAAQKEVLSRAGVEAPKRIEISGPNRGPVETRVQLDLSKLSKDELRVLAALRQKATKEEDDGE